MSTGPGRLASILRFSQNRWFGAEFDPGEEPRRAELTESHAVKFPRAVSFLISAILAAGCSHSTETPETRPTIQSASRPPSPGSGPATTVPHDECNDAVGDGGQFDLKSVTVDADEDTEVTVTFDLNSAVPQSGSAELGIYVASGDGKVSRQLAVKWTDGQTYGPFVADLGDAKQESVGEDALVQKGDKFIVATFPGATVTDLGKGWKWSAFANADGDDTDACPGPAGAVQYQPFAGDTEMIE